jgi:hypothetical protein
MGILDTIDLESREAPAQINRAIADLKGFHVYHYDKDHEANCYYQLWDGLGNPVWESYTGSRYGEEIKRGWHAGERKTEAEAWADVHDWAGDEQRALSLIERYHDFALVCRPQQGCVASFDGAYLLVSEPSRWWSLEQKAMAIACAWIEWAGRHPDLVNPPKPSFGDY